jgi:hypothetical protein
VPLLARQGFQDVPPDLRPLEIEDGGAGEQFGPKGWRIDDGGERRGAQQQRLRSAHSSARQPSSGRSTRGSSGSVGGLSGSRPGSAKGLETPGAAQPRQRSDSDEEPDWS